MKTGIFISIIKDFTKFNFYTSFVICLILNHTIYSQSGFIDFQNIEFGKTVEPSYKSMSDSSKSLSVVESNYLLSVDEMIDNIKDKKIVIINEHHEIPQNRIFWRLLARKLYAYGYNKIFIEAILDLDSNYDEHNYVSLKLGNYTKEPTFKKFLNEVHKKFKIHEYEISFSHSVFLNDSINNFVKRVSDTFIEKDKAFNLAGDMSLRDYYQSINIINQIEPNDKVIIFCGFGHVSTKPKQYWLPLGFWLKYLYTNSIASIDQTTLLGYNFEGINPNLYNKFYSNFYSILKVNNQYLKEYCDTIRDIISHVDYSVVNPKVSRENGRSSWINFFNDSKEVFIEPKKSESYPLTYYVYNNEDLCYFEEKSLDSSMFPCAYDVLKVDKYVDSIMLFVPKNKEYSIIIRDKYNQLLK